MFSPETFNALYPSVANNSKAINDNKTEIDKKWEKSTITLPDAFVTAIETSFTNAEESSLFEDSHSSSSTFICWYGAKKTAAKAATAFFLLASNTTTCAGIASRDKDGNWTFTSIV